MLKEITWDNSNKMHMDSGFKLFDKQTNVISTGNVWANTQYSSFIRPYKEIVNGGYIGKEGDFLKFDMQYFQQVPEFMHRIIYDKDREKSVILYQFKVYHGEQKEIIGYVLTDYDHYLIGSLAFAPYGRSAWKREDAIYEAMKYICEQDENGRFIRSCEREAIA